jgi:hypothetical protein
VGGRLQEPALDPLLPRPAEVVLTVALDAELQADLESRRGGIDLQGRAHLDRDVGAT